MFQFRHGTHRKFRKTFIYVLVLLTVWFLLKRIKFKVFTRERNNTGFIRIMGAGYRGRFTPRHLLPTRCIEISPNWDSEFLASCLFDVDAVLIEFDSPLHSVIKTMDLNFMVHNQRSEILIAASLLDNDRFLREIEARFCIVRVSASAEGRTKCALPAIDPYSVESQAFSFKANPLSCQGLPYQTSYKHNKVNVVVSLPSGAKVSYQPIQRVTDTRSALGPSAPISDPVPDGLDHLVAYVKASSWSEQTDYHWTISETMSAKSRQPSKEGLPFNIAMVGFDSVSAAEFQRQQPAAYRLLMEELGGIQLTGYNIVGDGTTPTLLGILTGAFEYELPEGRKGFPNASHIDSWPWIFREMKEHGWVTSYAEDDVVYGTFQYRLMGFRKPPTDHYAGPFFWIQPDGLCIGPKPTYEFILEHTMDLLRSYTDQKKFYLGFSARLTHNTMNRMSELGTYLFDFLQRLKKEGHLDKTIFVLFSDHGLRSGAFRSTHQGSLEERLPIFIILLPEKFRTQFPELLRNLLTNSKQLVTPFDIHQTLRHIVTYPRFVPKPHSHGASLLLPLEPRTCKEASVPDHHCSCMSWRSLPHNTDLATRVAAAVVSSINNQLDLHPAGNRSCHRHSLSLVSSLDLAEPNLDMFHFLGPQDMHGRVAGIAQYREGDMMMVECRYRVMFETRPANATFEATVLKTHHTFHVVGEVSRTNQYGSQSACLQENYPYLRTICTCLDFSF